MYKAIFLNNFGKTVGLNFDGLTGINFTKDAKIMFHRICQIYLTTVKLPYLIENDILNNFKSAIYSELWRLQIHDLVRTFWDTVYIITMK